MDKVGVASSLLPNLFICHFFILFSFHPNIFFFIQTSFVLQYKDYCFNNYTQWAWKVVCLFFFWLYLTVISVPHCSILQLLLHPAMFSHHNSLGDSSVTDLGTEGETATSPAHINDTCVPIYGISSSFMESSFCTASHLTFPDLAHSKSNNHYYFNKDCFPETKITKMNGQNIKNTSRILIVPVTFQFISVSINSSS